MHVDGHMDRHEDVHRDKNSSRDRDMDCQQRDMHGVFGLGLARPVHVQDRPCLCPGLVLLGSGEGQGLGGWVCQGQGRGIASDPGGHLDRASHGSKRIID